MIPKPNLLLVLFRSMGTENNCDIQEVRFLFLFTFCHLLGSFVPLVSILILCSSVGLITEEARLQVEKVTQTTSVKCSVHQLPLKPTV